LVDIDSHSVSLQAWFVPYPEIGSRVGLKTRQGRENGFKESKRAGERPTLL
jgi:hypothetical protein